MSYNMIEEAGIDEFCNVLEEYPADLAELEAEYQKIATLEWDTVIEFMLDELGSMPGMAGRDLTIRLKLELLIDVNDLPALSPIEFDEFCYYLAQP